METPPERKGFLLLVEEGNTEAVELLLKQHKDCLSWRDEKRNTALHLAALHGHEIIMAKLLGAGADPEATNVNREEGLDHFTPLHYAAHKGNLEAIRVLLRAGANVNAGDRSGMTPLMRAIEGRHERAAWVLLGGGARPLATDHNGMDSAAWAARSRMAKLLPVLLEGRDVDATDKRGMTALGHAAKSNRVSAGLYLLERGAQPCLKDLNGVSPLDRALKGGYWRLVLGMLSTGVPMSLLRPDELRSVVKYIDRPTRSFPAS